MRVCTMMRTYPIFMKYVNLMKLLFLMLLAVFCFSCNEKQRDPQVLCSIDLDSALSILPEITDVEYIPLATNDTSLIADIDKILYRGGTFYVFDKLGKKVLLFDRQGNFLKSIHKVGQGPGEYAEPCDMDIDEEGTVYLSDWATQSIIMYRNGDENDCQTIRIGEHFLDFAVVDGSIYLGLVYKDGQVNRNLAVWNREKGCAEPLKINSLPEGNKLPYRAKHYMFRSDDKVFFYERFHPYIYHLEANVVDSYVFFSSKKVPTEEEVKLWAECAPMDQVQKSFQYIADVSGCYETDSCILIEFQSLPVSYCVVDKNTGKKYCLNSREAVCIPPKGIRGVADNCLLSYFSPSKEMQEKLLRNLPAGKGVERLKALSEEDNPVLLLFKFNGKI